MITATVGLSQSIWNGGGTDDNWSTAANWDNLPAGTVDLQFSGLSRLNTINDIAGLTAGEIRFLSGAGAFTLGGPEALTLTGDIINNLGSNNTQIIDLDLILGADITVIAGGAGQNVTINGQISEIGGSRSLSKTGTGTLFLNHTSNSFSGDITVLNGTLRVAELNSLGTGAGPIRLGNNAAQGVLAFDETTAPGVIGRPIQIGSDTSNVNHSGGSRINTNNTELITFSAPLFNAPQPTAAVLRTLVLGGNSGGQGLIEGVIANNNIGNGIVALTKLQAGTWTLTGLNTFTGPLRVEAGTLSVNTIGLTDLNFGTASTLGAGSEIQLTGGGTLRFDNEGDNNEVSSNRTLRLEGNGTLESSNGAGIHFNGFFIGATSNGSATLTLTGSSNLRNEIESVISDTDPSNVIGITKNGAGTWILSGNNLFTGNVAIFRGTLEVDDFGNAGVSGNLGAGDRIQFGNGVQSGVLNYVGDGTSSNRLIDLRVGNNTGGGRINANGTGALILTGDMSHSGVPTELNSKTFILAGTADAAIENVFAGLIQDQNELGPVTLQKDGTATWLISGTDNTFTGGTILRGNGTLLVGSSTALGAGTVTFAANNPNLDAKVPLTGSDALANDFILDTNANIGGESLELIGSLDTRNANRVLRLYGEDKILSAEIMSTGNTEPRNRLSVESNVPGVTTFARPGIMPIRQLLVNGGADSIVTIAAGTVLELNHETNTGINSTEGGTINGEGTLFLTETAVASRTFRTSDGTRLTVDVRVSGNSFEMFGGAESTGVVVLTHPENDFSNFRVATGIVEFTNGGALGTSQVLDLAASQTLNPATLRYTGTGEIINKGIRLHNAGGTGAIEAAGTGEIEFTGNITTAANSPRTLQLMGAGDGRLSGVIGQQSAVNFTALLKTGSGAWTLSGNNTYTGGTTVSDGALFVNGSLAEGLVEVEGGALLAGNGTIGGDVLLMGTSSSPAVLRPGAAQFPGGIDLLTIEGSLTMAEYSIVEFYLSQTGHTKLAFDELISIHSTARFKFTLAPGYIPSDGSVFEVLSWGNTPAPGGDPLGIADWLPYLDLPELDPEFVWTTSSFGLLGIVGSDGLAEPVAITLQPLPEQTVSAGDTASITIGLSGADPIFVQWYKRETPESTPELLTGATHTTLTIPNAAADDAGIYFAIATSGQNIGAPVTSNNAILNVVGSPLIVAQPQAVTVFERREASFEVEAVGPGTLSYQWQLNGEDIPDATSSSYLINSAETSQAGSYTVVISTDAGFTPTTSDPAILTVQPAIVVTTGLENQTATLGGSATFFIVVEGDDEGGPFTFQWQFNDVNNGWTDLGGEEGDSLTVTATAEAFGQYRVLITNYAGVIFPSDPALLIEAPGDVVIDADPQSQIVLSGEDLLLEVESSGALPRRYQWRFNGRDIPGATEESLTIEGIVLTQAGEYSCVVTNDFSTETSAVANVAVVDGRHEFIAVRDSSARARLSVVARARRGADLSYQWLDSSDNEIPGATAARYTVTELTANQRHEFRCRVTYAPAADPIEGGITEVYVYSAAPQLDPAMPASTVDSPIPLPAARVSQPYSYQIPLPGQNIVLDANGTPSGTGSADASRMPESYRASGLPRGMRVERNGLLSGVPTTERRDRDGNVIPYLITITPRNAYGSLAPPLVFSLLIEPLNETVIGDFTGPIERHPLNDNLGGAVLVKTNKRGGYSGTLTMGTKRHRFRGVLISDAESANPEALVRVNRGRRLPALEMAFSLDAAAEVIQVGNIREITDTSGDMDRRANFTGWRYTFRPSRANRTPAIEYAGIYNLGLDLPSDLTDFSSVEIPQGMGFASFNVNRGNGRTSVRGRLSDGAAFTTSTFVGPVGQVLIFRTLYSSRARGSVVGSFTINKDEIIDMVTETKGGLEGELDWLRPAGASATLYPDGFAVPNLQVEGSRYVPPTAGVPVMGLDLGTPGDNAILQFQGARVFQALPSMPQVNSLDDALPLRITDRNRTEITQENPRNITFRVTPRSGTFNGRFVLTEPNTFQSRPATITRRTNYQGLIVRSKVAGVWMPQGIGYFILRQLPDPAIAEPNLGGLITFARYTP